MVNKTRSKKQKKIRGLSRFNSDAPRHKQRINRYILNGGAGWDGSVIPKERIKIIYDEVPRREVPVSEIPDVLKSITQFANLTDICPVDLSNQPDYVLKVCKHPISSRSYGELARSQVPAPIQFGANLMFNCPICRAGQIPQGPLGGVFCPAVEKNPGLPMLRREPGKTRSSDKCESLEVKEIGNTKTKYSGILPNSNLVFTIEIHPGVTGFEAHIILPKPRPRRGGKSKKYKKRKSKKRKSKKR